MTKGQRLVQGSALELWRPPQDSGEPIGCISTTYTFDAGLFDEQCLARFLEIESEPDRENLAFLLERESRLGSAYAGVLVDHSQAGREHSLRWDVVPVRIPAAKQHAKLTLLAWAKHVRLIVASANLTEAGYRYNQEVAVAVDSSSSSGVPQAVIDACDFIESIFDFVPTLKTAPPAVQRGQVFLRQVRRLLRGWSPASSRGRVRRQLVCTLPGHVSNGIRRSSLAEAMAACRSRGSSPREACVASPFFDVDGDVNVAAAALCKALARGDKRCLYLAIPSIGDQKERHIRLAAPRSLLLTARRYCTDVSVELLPQHDADRNRRPWHAKMLALWCDDYTAMAIGSSNFTGAGLGIHGRCNAEANLLTIIDRDSYAREPADLESIWPEMKQIDDPDSAEWVGPVQEMEEEESERNTILPAGFVLATYRAGNSRQLIFHFDSKALPDNWSVWVKGRHDQELLSAPDWHESGTPEEVTLSWEPRDPPARLHVIWSDGEAVWPFNVEDSRQLPPPSVLDEMTADDMLEILAASDPSAAFRAWARQHQPKSPFDEDLDSIGNADLDPLRRHDLHATFLHRIRRRARILAKLRLKLQQPVWSIQALDWRLRGFIGVEPLAMKLLREVVEADCNLDEALLTLADLLIVLRDVDYECVDGALKRGEIEAIYFPFLRQLSDRLSQAIGPRRHSISSDIIKFWDGVVQQCQK